jgi:hypothetical protein
MTNYPYTMQLVVDPDNPRNVVAAGAVSIYDGDDTAHTTLLTLTDPSGVPISNPITSNANGFTPPFVTTSPQVLWVSAGYTDYFQSYKGMRDEAVAAVAAAEAAAANAGAEAAVVATAAIGDATADAEAAAASAATAATNASASATAAANAASLVGAPADTAMATVANNTSSAFRGALNSTYGPDAPGLTAKYTKLDGALATNSNTHRLMAKLYRGVEDASILSVSDSTGATDLRWVRLMANTLASRFPAYTVIYHLWGESVTVDPSGNSTYSTNTTIQTGTGSQTLHIWNFAASGQATWFGLGSRWGTAVTPTNPDLVFINHGKNEGTVVPGGMTPAHWRGQYLALTESLTAQFPYAGIVCILQCPNTGNTDMAIKARVYEELAQQRGYGVVNVHDAFMATGHYADYIRVDGVHPTDSSDPAVTTEPFTNGSQIWADQVTAALKFDRNGGAPHPQSQSSLAQTEAQLLPNGQFTAFTAAVPDSWTATACTTSKDTRAGYFESTNGYGVRLQASSAAQSYISQFIPSFASYKGRWVTLTVRIRVPLGQTASAGRIAIADGTQTVTAQTMQTAQDGFMWKTVSMQVSNSASYLRVFLYGDTASTATADVTYDAAYLVAGSLPKRATQGVPGPAGAVGPSSPTQVEHLSTISTNPLITAALASSALTVSVANQGIFVPFKPQRDMSIADLEWVCGTASGNYDVGLYSISGTTLTKLWSKGSTAWPAGGTDVIEVVSPSVPLIAGTQYFLGFSGDNTTGSFRGLSVNQAHMRMLDGTYYATIASSMFPLPASLTRPTTYSQKIPGVVFRES